MSDDPTTNHPLRLHHDRLAKLMSRAVLAGCATVQIGVELLPDSLTADVLAEPRAALPLDLPGAGLLSRLVGSRLALLESFSAAVAPLALRSAVAKLHLVLRLCEQRRQPGAPPARGCLVVVTPESAGSAIAAVLGGRGGAVAPGVRCWGNLDPVFVVRADRVGERLDTLFFRLQARGAVRRVAVVQVYRDKIEPYESVLDNFDRRYREMAVSHAEVLAAVDAEEAADLRELVDTRRDVLLALGEARGEARGRAEAVLAVFEARGLPVTPKQRSQVVSCRDLAQLDRWLRRAITASSVAEALGGTYGAGSAPGSEPQARGSRPERVGK